MTRSLALCMAILVWRALIVALGGWAGQLTSEELSHLGPVQRREVDLTRGAQRRDVDLTRGCFKQLKTEKEQFLVLMHLYLAVMVWPQTARCIITFTEVYYLQFSSVFGCRLECVIVEQLSTTMSWRPKASCHYLNVTDSVNQKIILNCFCSADIWGS